MRFGQITLITPLHCRRGRSTAFGMTFPAASNGSYNGTILPVLSTSFRKSPLRNSSSGAVTSEVDWPFLVGGMFVGKEEERLVAAVEYLGEVDRPANASARDSTGARSAASKPLW